jgi:hypothetical protein
MKTNHYSPYASAQAGAPGKDGIGALFQPDALLNDQYMENFRGKAQPVGEKALLLAVLEDAVRCFQDNVLPGNGKKQMLFEDAERWLFSDAADWLFSFVSICAALGLEPGYIRQGLRRWQERACAPSRKRRRRSRATQQRLVA